MKRVVKKPEERRKEILKAARAMFLTREYDKTTMQDLMETLNIAKGTIYHYFSSKEDLLEAVVEEMVDEELAKKKEVLSAPEARNLNALEKMRLLVQEDAMAEENERILEMLHHPGATLLHTRQLSRYLLKLAPLFADVIEQGCTEGLFKTEHPLECAEFLLAGIQFLTDIGFYPWSEDELHRRLAAFPSLVEAQLSAPEGSFCFLFE